MMMNKKIIIAVVGACLVIAGGVFVFRNKSKSIKQQLKTIEEEMVSYYLEGDLEMMDGDDTRKFQVEVNYLKVDGKDYFSVALHDKLTNQDQIIIRNGDGVYVVTPSLNRAFEFKSEWPNNSMKPYIYQSLLSVFDGDYKKEKTKDGYLITANVAYVSNPNAVLQEVKFTKDLHPEYVNVLNEDDIEIIQFVVNEFEMNGEVEMSKFDIYQYINPTSNDSSTNTDTETSALDDLPLYPLEVMGSVLEEVSAVDVDGVINHILKFDGEKNFTIIESSLSKANSFLIEKQSGDLIDLIGRFGIYNEGDLQVIDSAVVTEIYSSDLSVDEMISVINSMQQAVLK